MFSLAGDTAMSGTKVSGTVTELQTSVAQLSILYELSPFIKRLCREFRVFMNLMFTSAEQTWFRDFTIGLWILMLCDYLCVEDIGFVLTNLEVMFLL